MSKEILEDTSPIPIRANEEYKGHFRDISKSFNTQKECFEFIIDSYLYKEKQKEREDSLSFKSEIGLISSNLDNILRIFKSIATKSQDTVGSIENNYAQQIENLNRDNNTAVLEKDGIIKSLEQKVEELTNANELLQAANKGYTLEKNQLLDDIENLKIELTKYKDKNTDLINDLHELRNIERQNLALTSEKAQLLNELKVKDKEIQDINRILHSKDNEIQHLTSQKNNLNAELKDISSKLKDEIAEVTEKSNNQINDLKVKDKEIEDINRILHSKEDEIQHLTSQNNKLNAELKDISSKLKDEIAEVTEKSNNQINEIIEKCKKEIALIKESTDVYTSNLKSSLEKEIEHKYIQQLLSTQEKYNKLQISYHDLQLANINLVSQSKKK
jgi:chromosome segregation ATPase